jgi:hypothetical protein
MSNFETIKNKLIPIKGLLIMILLGACNLPESEINADARSTPEYNNTFKDYKPLYFASSPSGKFRIEFVGIQVDRSTAKETPEPDVYPSYFTYDNVRLAILSQLHVYESELKELSNGTDSVFKNRSLKYLNEQESQKWNLLSTEKKVNLYKWYTENQIELIKRIISDELPLQAKVAIDAYNKPSCAIKKGTNPTLDYKPQEVEDGIYLDNCLTLDGYSSFINTKNAFFQYGIAFRPSRKYTDYFEKYNKSYLRELRKNQEESFATTFGHELSHIITFANFGAILIDKFWDTFQDGLTKADKQLFIFAVEHTSLEYRENVFGNEMIKQFDLKDDTFNFPKYQDEYRFEPVTKTLKITDLLSSENIYSDSDYIFYEDNTCVFPTENSNGNRTYEFFFAPSFISVNQMINASNDLSTNGSSQFNFNKMCLSGTFSPVRINADANFAFLPVTEPNQKKTELNPGFARLSGITIVRIDPKTTKIPVSSDVIGDLSRLVKRLNEPK